jgi:PAS domain S-box-containing protein
VEDWQISIQKKLLSGYLVIVVVAIGVGYFSALATKEVNNTFHSISSHTIPAIDAVNDLRYNAARAMNNANELAMVMSRAYPKIDPSFLKHQEEEMDEAFAKFRSSLDRYRTLVGPGASEQESNVLEMIVSTSNTLQELIQGLVDLARKGVMVDELFVHMEKVEAYELSFLNSVDAALATEVKLLDSKRDTMHNAISRSRDIAVVFGPASVLIAVFITMYFSRRTMSVLRRLKNASLAVASGNLNTRVRRVPGEEFDDVIQTFNEMAAKLNSNAESADAVNAYLHEILNTMSELMIITGLDGKIVTVNAATTKWLDWTEKELAGRSVDELFGNEYREKVLDSWQPKLVGGGSIPHARVTYVHNDKHEIPMIVSASGMRNRDGVTDGIVYKAIPESQLSPALSELDPSRKP